MNGAAMLDPCLGYLLVSAYVVFFAWAASLKWSDIHAFGAVLDRYRLLPSVTAPLAARLIAGSESAIAILLLLPGSRTTAALLGGGLCAVYALAIGINLIRGRRDLDCGCLGPLKRRPISGWMVWRNSALAALLLLVALPWSPRPLELTDGVTIAAGAGALALLYAAIDSLMAVGLRMRTARNTS